MGVELMDTFGARLKALRRGRRLSQVQLAEALGMSQTTISNLELRATPPSKLTIDLLCNFFGASENYFLDYDDEDDRPDTTLLRLDQAERDLVLAYRQGGYTDAIRHAADMLERYNCNDLG